MALVHPDQIALTGNHNVATARVFEIFAVDRGDSVLRIPLDERRKQLESLPWIEQAAVRRALPNRIQIEITERTPIAFVREPGDMALIDVHGVILDRPLEGNFHFPVIAGISREMPLEDRAIRMQLYAGFAQQIGNASAGALDHVSEVDLSDEHDVRATLTALRSANAGSTQTDAPILVHFGDSDFAGKYQTLVDNIDQWRAKAGPVESVDLRFNHQAVVNQDTSPMAQLRAPKPVASRPAQAAPKHPAAVAAKGAKKTK